MVPAMKSCGLEFRPSSLHAIHCPHGSSWFVSLVWNIERAFIFSIELPTVATSQRICETFFRIRVTDEAITRMGEYGVVLPMLSLYDSSQCSRVATEAWAGRHFRPVESLDLNSPSIFKDPVKIVLCEDWYECWLAPEDAKRAIAPVKEGEKYQHRVVEKEEVQERMPDVINFVMGAHQSENRYLWGGTAGPHFDCSGLVQRAYSSVGIWLPRDAYQQEEFVEKVPDEGLKRGDLLFFGVERATHVGICVEVPSRHEGCSDLGGDAPPVKYIHASSSTHGHGRIELDELSLNAGPVAKHYFSMYRASGRIVRRL